MASNIYNRNLYNLDTSVLAYVLIFLSPFSFYRINIGGLGLTVINIMTIILIMFFSILFLKNYKIYFDKITILHLLYLLVATFGALFAMNPSGSVSGIGSYFIKFYFCFFFVVIFLTGREQLETGVKIFIVAGLINAAMGWIELIGFYIYGEIITPPFGSYFFGTTKAYGFVDRGGIGAFSIPGFMRMYGFMNEGANTFGTYMLVPFGLSIYWAGKNNKKKRKLLPIFFGLTIICSVSRNALLGMIVIMIVPYLIKSLVNKNLIRSLFRISMIVSALMVLLLFSFYISNSNFYDNSYTQISDTSTNSTIIYLLERVNPFESNSIQKSILFFSQYLKYALIHSFDNFGFGMGLQNFDNYVFFNYDVSGYSAHSNFIIFLGDTGIWGFLIQALIVILTIKYGFQTFVIENKDNKDRISLYLTSIFIGLVVTGIVRTYYLDTYTFIVMGLIVNEYLRKPQNNNLANQVY